METDVWKQIREDSKNGTKQRIAQSLENIIQDEVKTLKYEELDKVYAKEQDYIEKEVERRVAKAIKEKEKAESSPYDLVFTKEEKERIREFREESFKEAKENRKEYRGAIGGAEGIKTVWTSLGEIVAIYSYGQELVIRGTKDW